MNTIPLSRTQSQDVQANPGLSHYLSSLQEGREATPHSWLYENEDSDVTLARWETTLQTLRSEGEFGNKVYQFDVQQKSKFGPQGKVPPISEALITLEPQFEQSEYDSIEALDAKLSDADEVRIAKTLFGASYERCRPKELHSVIDDMRARDTLVTNSGWPLFTRRSNPSVIKASIDDAESGECYNYPAIILFRAYNGKLRPVWMFPMSMNLLEFSFTQAIQEALVRRKNSYVTPWEGFDAVEAMFTKMWYEDPVATGGDTTAMDAHFRKAHTHLVYRVVRHLFQPKYWEALRTNMLHVNDVEIVVGSDAKLVGNHGVASGSGWTQLVETVFQIIMFMSQMGEARPLGNTGMGIGDDFVWFGSGTWSGGTQERATAMVDYLQSYGLPANPSKQSTESDYCTFLQRLFAKGWDRDRNIARANSHVSSQKELLGIYPTVRALNSLLNPEKFHSPKLWNSDMFCIRCFMILENCVGHPLFHEFCTFVVKGQKDLIPFAKKTISELANIQKASKSIPGLNPSYNQEKLTKPLSEFESIKFVRAM